MSKRLAPMSVILANPADPRVSAFSSSIIDQARNNIDLQTNPVLKSFVGGSLSGTCSTILFQPLDLIKTRIQQHASGRVVATSQYGIINRPSMFAMTRHVLTTENIFGLWRGVIPSIARTVPGVGIHFGSLHLLKVNFNVDEGNAFQTLALGMTARCFAATAMIPITVIKTRYESGCFGYSRISSALITIYRNEGINGLGRGLVPTLVRDAPFSGIYLMFYTQLKRKMSEIQSSSSIINLSTSSTTTSILHFGCGITAGLAASVVTHPADVIKTRMQLNTGDLIRSIPQVTLVILKENGIRGLFVGMAPRMLRRSLMSALTWTVYERFMKSAGLK